MKTLLVIAMILGSGTFANAHASWHHLPTPSHAENFMGSVVDPRLVTPLDRDLGTCNGGACTLTGGPSGGPNQS